MHPKANSRFSLQLQSSTAFNCLHWSHSCIAHPIASLVYFISTDSGALLYPSLFSLTCNLLPVGAKLSNYSSNRWMQFVAWKANSSLHTLTPHKHTPFHSTWTLRQDAKELEECDLLTLACRLPQWDRTPGWRATEEEARIAPVSGNGRQTVCKLLPNDTRTQSAGFAQVMETHALGSRG